MALSDSIDDPHLVQGLRNKFGDKFSRVNEMYLGDPPLQGDYLRELVTSLLLIDNRIVRDQIKPALETNQGLFRSMEERASKGIFNRQTRNDKDFRVKLRSWVLLRSARVSIEMKLGDQQASRFSFAEDMKSRLKDHNLEGLTDECNAYARHITEMLNAEKQGVLALQQADAERRAAEKRRKLQEEAAKTILRYYGAYTTRRTVASKVHSKYRKLGNEQLAAAAKSAEKELLRELRAAKTAVKTEFIGNFEDVLLNLIEVGRWMDQANEKFNAAIKKDDKSFKEAREFKQKCVGGLFEMIGKYAPPPVNLVGVTGTALIKSATTAYKYTLQGIKTAEKSTDPNIREAAKRAEERLKLLENTVAGDHGVKTKFKADLSVADHLTVAIRETKKVFYQELEQVVAEQKANIPNAQQLIGRKQGELSRLMESQWLSANFFQKKIDLYIRKAGLVSASTTLKEEIKRNVLAIYREDISTTTDNMDAPFKRLAEIPPITINISLGKGIAQRYMYMFLAGFYLDEKIANNPGKLFVFQSEIAKLLSEEAKFLHDYNHNVNRSDIGLGMSLPWVLTNASNSTNTFVGGHHRSWGVRANLLLRRYSRSVDFNPFAILLRNVSSSEINRAVQNLDDDIGAEINRAKKLPGFNYFSASPRKQAYLAMQRSR